MNWEELLCVRDYVLHHGGLDATSLVCNPLPALRKEEVESELISSQTSACIRIVQGSF